MTESESKLSLEEMLKLARTVQDWKPARDAESWQSYKGNTAEFQVLVTEFKAGLSGWLDFSYRIEVSYQEVPIGSETKRWSSKRNVICQLYRSLGEHERVRERVREKKDYEERMLEEYRLAQEGLIKARSN